MSSFGLSITLSGLNAEFTQAAATADNIARRNVPNSERTRVLRQSQDERIGGVTVTTDKVTLSTAERTDDKYSLDATNIDYAQEAIEQIRSRVSIQSGYNLVGMVDDMLATLVNLTV